MLRRIKIILGILSIFLFLSIFVFGAYLEKTYDLKKEDFSYVPPYRYINILSGNFKSLFADMFLIRGIMAIGEEKTRSLNYVLDNLRLASRLNPRLTYAYIVGGIIAPRGSNELPTGIRFLKEGMERAPSDWRLPFWAGFNYLQLGNKLKAAEYYEKASTMPDAPNYLKSMTARYYYEADESDIAVMYLEGIRNSVKEPRLLKNIETKIAWLKNIVFLEEKVGLFRQIYGYWPNDLQELVKSGLIEKIPADPFGKGYEIDKNRHNSPARVKSKF